MNKLKLVIATLLLSSSFRLFGQGNTLSFSDGQTSPPARLSDISWIEGHWKGEAFGGITEEIWGSPIGKSMMCVFKQVVNGEVRFYEIESIVEEENTLMLRLKHFDSKLKGWEEKDKTIDFKLVRVTENRIYFDDYTFEKVGENEMNVYVVIEIDGVETEVKFHYNR